MLALILLVAHPIAEAQSQATENELKAAIIANMLLFVEWPAQKDSPSAQLTLCYLDSNPVTRALAQLDGKLFKGKSLKVIMTKPDVLAGCHAVYFAAENAALLSKFAGPLRNEAVLLIGDTPGYLERGVMINLELVSGRIIFDIDLHSAQTAALKISSKVLRLARQVIN